jgi:formate dehydrogenase major subunit
MQKMAKKENTKKNKRGLTRRDFFKVSAAAGAAGGFTSALDWAVVPPTAMAATDKTMYSICPYCSVGCSLKIDLDSTAVNWDDKVVDIYGDTGSPISNGSLCSKGASAIQYAKNPQRLVTPKYKLGNGSWVNSTWEAAMVSGVPGVIDSIPKLMADTKAASGANAATFLGCAHATNEANYIYRKLVTEFGTNNIEHQARI